MDPELIMIREHILYYKIIEKLGEDEMFQNYPLIKDEWFIILITPINSVISGVIV